MCMPCCFVQVKHRGAYWALNNLIRALAFRRVFNARMWTSLVGRLRKHSLLFSLVWNPKCEQTVVGRPCVTCRDWVQLFLARVTTLYSFTLRIYGSWLYLLLSKRFVFSVTHKLSTHDYVLKHASSVTRWICLTHCGFFLQWCHSAYELEQWLSCTSVWLWELLRSFEVHVPLAS